MHDIIKKKTISYSQYSVWRKCKRKYKLDYINNLRTFEGSINTCFGTAIHEAVQLYIKTLYTVDAIAAQELNLNGLFESAFDRELKKEKNKVIYSPEEFAEFKEDAKNIINEFLKNSNRLKHFPNSLYEFVGTEFVLEAAMKNNIKIIAYVDLILKNKNTGIYKIFDFKTSSTGWNSYMKIDETKTSQLLLYKTLYSKIFNVHLDMIDVEFFILKRKLYTDPKYPQTRIQTFSPPNGKQSIFESIDNIAEFINECFTKDGDYKLDGDFSPNPGKGKKNCKFCKYYKTENCDGKEDSE